MFVGTPFSWQPCRGVTLGLCSQDGDQVGGAGGGCLLTPLRCRGSFSCRHGAGTEVPPRAVLRPDPCVGFFSHCPYDQSTFSSLRTGPRVLAPGQPLADPAHLRAAPSSVLVVAVETLGAETAAEPGAGSMPSAWERFRALSGHSFVHAARGTLGCSVPGLQEGHPRWAGQRFSRS